jgi:hypothetical protein
MLYQVLKLFSMKCYGTVVVAAELAACNVFFPPFCSIADCYCDKRHGSWSVAEIERRCLTEVIQTRYCCVLGLQLLKYAGRIENSCGVQSVCVS